MAPKSPDHLEFIPSSVEGQLMSCSETYDSVLGGNMKAL